MKILYKFFLRNEQEIRQDLPARHVYVAADSLLDAVNGFVDNSSLVTCVEFVSPITVVPSKANISSVDFNLLFQIIYRDKDGDIQSALVHANDSLSPLSRLQAFLGYSPVIESSKLIEDLVI